MNPKFKSHAFNANQQAVSDLVRETGTIFDKLLDKIPDCRERSIAKTRLEECVMWANKAIALHGGNDK